MRTLYVTADRIGTPTGGGTVTLHESRALATLGECVVLDQSVLGGGPEPWGSDAAAAKKLDSLGRFDLAHFYAGTFGDTVSKLKAQGCRVTYTIAAHSREISRREHEKLGIDFAKNYEHLCSPELWRRYIEGYRLADVIVCPGTVPAQTVREYGGEFVTKRIACIPHGCDLPTEKCSTCSGTSVVAGTANRWDMDEEYPCNRCKGSGNVSTQPTPLPDRFVCGYMGAMSCDKGIVYLLQAWKRLEYKDALLVLAGRDSLHPHTRQLVSQFGGGSVHFAGWQNNVSDFYNNLSLYVQPSATEGFGIEVVEAMAHGRVALCSVGAGAVDISLDQFSACDSEAIAAKIDEYKRQQALLPELGAKAQDTASRYTWASIRERYVDLWQSVIGKTEV